MCAKSAGKSVGLLVASVLLVGEGGAGRRAGVGMGGAGMAAAGSARDAGHGFGRADDGGEPARRVRAV